MDWSSSNDLTEMEEMPADWSVKATSAHTPLRMRWSIFIENMEEIWRIDLQLSISSFLLQCFYFILLSLFLHFMLVLRKSYRCKAVELDNTPFSQETKTKEQINCDFKSNRSNSENASRKPFCINGSFEACKEQIAPRINF